MTNYPSFDSNSDDSTAISENQERAKQRQQEIEEIQQMPRWALVDATGLLHKAHHAFAHVKGPSGQGTGVLYGTINFMHKYMKAMNGPDHVVAVFDAPGGSYERLALYPDYKKQRPPRPEEIKKQEPWVHAFLRASGIPVVSVLGVESDDVLAAIAKKESIDKRVAILSSDKDMGSTIRKNILWYRPDPTAENGVTHMTRKIVQERFGIAPHQFVDYLALLGDTADNLPGVDKVGNKTAVKLLTEFGSIEAVYAAMAENDGLAKMEKVLGSKTKTIWKNLSDAQEIMPTMQSLIRLRDEIPIARDLYANREPVNDQMMREMAAEHGLPPWMGYVLPWQQERATAMNQAKNDAMPTPRMKL